MIAVSFALGVVEPEASGIGGDGSAVLYLKGMKKPTVIEYKDMTPIKATPDNPLIMQDGRIVADGPAAANIPGVVAGLDYSVSQLRQRQGEVGRSRRAGDHARRRGLHPRRRRCRRASPKAAASSRSGRRPRRSICPDGKVPRPGDRFFNKDYATTLRAIQKDGADAFYRGEIAQEDRRRHGRERRHPHLRRPGAVPRDRARAGDRATIAATRCMRAARRCRPASSCSSRCTCSRTISRRPARARRRMPDYLHYLIESWKVRDPLRRVADPERWPVDFAEHLTDEHAKKLFAKIDPKKASRYERQPPDDAPTTPTAPTPRISTGTTSFAVADADGNMIAVTQTLSTWGGTFYVSKGLGFLYNNHLRSNRLTAGRLRQPGAADALEHGERADAGVREEGVGRGSAAAGGGLRRQRVDSGVGLQHHHRRDRRQARRAGGDRSAAVPARPRSRRSARERRAHRDRGSFPARRCCRT